MIKTSTFCSGIGSPEFGIDELSQELNFKYENVFACEIDANARKSYLANHKPNNMLLDMTKYDYKRSDIFQKEDKFYSDINVAGLPCQAFSIAGKRMGELDDRGILFFDYYRWIENQQPKVFIIENVKGLLSIENGTVFQNWLHLLGNSVNGHYQMFNHPDSLGYNLHYTVLNTKDYGIPQNRERVFIVGIRNDLPNDFRFPKGFPLTLRLKDILETKVDEKYYLSVKTINGFFKHGEKSKALKRGFKFNPISDTENEKASTITARCFKMGVDDNYIAEEQVTNLQDKEYINTIRTSGRGSIDDKHNWDCVIVPEATQKGYAEAEIGDSVNISNPNSKTRRGRVGKQIANTLETQCNQVVIEPQIIGYTRDKSGKVTDRHLKDHAGTIHTSYGSGGNTDQFVTEPTLNKVLQLPGFEEAGRVYDENGISSCIKANGGGGAAKSGYYAVEDNKGYIYVGDVLCRIRRLTPLETWRLQGFEDYTFHNAKNSGMSDTQLYKQAGNSMTKHVIKAIIKNTLHLL